MEAYIEAYIEVSIYRLYCSVVGKNLGLLSARVKLAQVASGMKTASCIGNEGFNETEL